MRGFGVFPSRAKSMYIVYIWPTGREAGLCLPMYRKSPEGLYTSTLHPPSDHPSNGWERPKQAGWEFRA